MQASVHSLRFRLKDECWGRKRARCWINAAYNSGRVIVPTHQQKGNRNKKKVAIIGAGPAGLACAKEMSAEGHSATVFEQSSCCGGTWVLQDVTTSSHQHEDTVCSSMYPSLRTNLPRELMSYIEFPFLPECMGKWSLDPRRFPKHEEVRAYLEAYAEHYDLHSMIQFNNQVTKVRLLEGQGNSDDNEMQWEVSTTRQADSFDAVVVCNGHYTKPYIPELPGADIFPGQQSHSRAYREPGYLEGKTVVVVGTSSSGQDISREIAKVADVVYLSGRRTEKPPNWMNKPMESCEESTIFHGPEIAELRSTGEVVFRDGYVLRHADVILYCTGFDYSFPFLEEGVISIEDRRVSPLYKDMFVPTLAPTLSFVGLTFTIVPFPLFEYQSKYIARVLSGRSQLASISLMEKDMQESYDLLLKNGLEPRQIHNMRYSQFEYVDWLAEQCGPDVQAYSSWRKELFQESSRMHRAHTASYKDMNWDDVECVINARKDLTQKWCRTKEKMYTQSRH